MIGLSLCLVRWTDNWLRLIDSFIRFGLAGMDYAAIVVLRPGALL